MEATQLQVIQDSGILVLNWVAPSSNGLLLVSICLFLCLSIIIKTISNRDFFDLHKIIGCDFQISYAYDSNGELIFQSLFANPEMTYSYIHRDIVH